MQETVKDTQEIVGRLRNNDSKLLWIFMALYGLKHDLILSVMVLR